MLPFSALFRKELDLLSVKGTDGSYHSHAILQAETNSLGRGKGTQALVAESSLHLSGRPPQA